MGQRSYVRLVDGTTRIRVNFSTGRGQVLEFTIQLEVQLEGNWQPVIRYDTAHGFAHKDVYRRDGSYEKVPIFVGSFGDALSYAQAELGQNWRQYRDRFLGELGL